MSDHLLLLAAGAVAGVINVVAGGGSFLTLPILIFLGVPATVANGTNRLAILMQNVGAVWGFRRHGVLPWIYLRRAALPSTLGAVAGAGAALLFDDASFERILAFLMVVISVLTLWRSPRGMAAGAAADRWVPLAFFLVGIYGGFIQAGVGFLLLAAGSLAGLDLVRGNAVKVLCALSFSAVSLVIFAAAGKVYWLHGASLGLGNLIGGQLGVHLTVLKGHGWVRGVVTIAVILFAIKLWLP